MTSESPPNRQGLIPGYTRKRRPVQFVFADEFPTRIDALERERQIKKWTRAKKQALINRDWSAPPTTSPQNLSPQSTEPLILTPFVREQRFVVSLPGVPTGPCRTTHPPSTQPTRAILGAPSPPALPRSW